MLKSLFFVVGVVVLLAGTSYAGDTKSGGTYSGGQKNQGMNFDDMDTNRDNRITQDEWNARNPGREKDFSDMDKEKKGYMNREEWQNFENVYQPNGMQDYKDKQNKQMQKNQ